MRQSLKILAQLEAAALEKMQPVYLQAITASLRNEDPEPYWAKFRELFERAYVMADLIGRLGVANEARTLGTRIPYSEPLITGSWDRAIELFLSKVPMARRLVDKLLPIARAKAFWVTGIESTEALEKIQERIAQRLTGEHPPGLFIQDVLEDVAAHLSSARLENVMRTNVMTALGDGAMDEVRSLGDSVALLRRNEVHDNRTRGAPGTGNPGFHWQMDGFVESPTHPIWERIKGACGFQCRGNVSVIGWASAERLGFALGDVLNQEALDRHNARRWEIINAGKFPDPGFN